MPAGDEDRPLAGTEQFWNVQDPEILTRLSEADVVSLELLPWGSNYTFLARLDAGAQGEGLAVYKPRRGEAPLWDFPDGTLYLREYGAYLLSRALGWHFIPPTVIRDGPHGIGTMQLFVPSVKGATYFTFHEERVADMQRMAAFDAFTNNADRKAGHCLLGLDGRVWGIDHGLCFNVDYKLRTVIWDFRSTPIPADLLQDMSRLLDDLEKSGPVGAELGGLIAGPEMDMLCRRLHALLEEKVFPEPGVRRSVPWPPV